MNDVPDDFWGWEGFAESFKLYLTYLPETTKKFELPFRPVVNAVAPFYTPYDSNE